jgi:hypothetical protein
MFNKILQTIWQKKTLFISMLSAVILLVGFMVVRADQVILTNPSVDSGYSIVFSSSTPRYISWGGYGGQSATANSATTANYATNVSTSTTATTATILAVNGGNCSGGQYALGVNAAGVAECATPSYPTNADTVDSQHFVWTIQSGSPAAVWGQTVTGTAYRYSPGNFSVLYANTAGNVSNSTYATSTTLAGAWANNGANCAAGTYLRSIDVYGAAATCSTPSTTPPSCTCSGSGGQVKTINSSNAEVCLNFVNGSYQSSGTCACTPDTCASLGYNCGTWSDGCGGTLNCGTCTLPAICDSGLCSSGGCTPNCTKKFCGDDGCGGSCGTCTYPQTCVNYKCITCTPDPCCCNLDGSYPPCPVTDSCGGSSCEQCVGGLHFCGPSGTCEGDF